MDIPGIDLPVRPVAGPGGAEVVSTKPTAVAPAVAASCPGEQQSGSTHCNTHGEALCDVIRAVLPEGRSSWSLT